MCLIKLLLRLNTVFSVYFLLYRNNQDFWVKRQELLDSKLLNLRWGGDELIESILLLLDIQVRKLLQKYLLIFLTKFV